MISEEQHRAAVEDAYREAFKDGVDCDRYDPNEYWSGSDARCKLDAPRAVTTVEIPVSVARDVEMFVREIDRRTDRDRDFSQAPSRREFDELTKRLLRALPLVPDSIPEESK